MLYFSWMHETTGNDNIIASELYNNNSYGKLSLGS